MKQFTFTKMMPVFFAVSVGLTLVLQLSGLMHVAPERKDFFYITQLTCAGLIAFSVGLPLWKKTHELLGTYYVSRTLFLAAASTLYFLYAFDAAITADKAMIRNIYLVPTSIVSVTCLLRLMIRQHATARLESLKQSFNIPKSQDVERVFENSTQTVTVNDIHEGDVIRIPPGSYVPFDGIVNEGQSVMDERLVYRKNMRTPKMPDDAVYAGSINGEAALEMRVIRTYQDSSQTVQSRLIHNMMNSKLPLSNRVQYVSRMMLYGVLLLAIILPLYFYTQTDGAKNGAHVLIISVVLLLCASPISAGLVMRLLLRRGFKRILEYGVLLQNAASLEALVKAPILALSRRGTLVDSTPELLHIMPTEGHSETNMLRLTASLAQNNDHPLAATIVQKAKERQIGLLNPHAYIQHPGDGISGIVDGRSVAIGNHALMKKLEISITVASKARPYQSQGQTVLYVAMDGQTIGILTFASKIEKETYDAVKQLQAEGFDTVLLTGDDTLTAQALARKLDISRYEAELTPKAKSAWLENHRERGQDALFVTSSKDDDALYEVCAAGIYICESEPLANEKADINVLTGSLKDLAAAKHIAQNVTRAMHTVVLLNIAYYVFTLSWACGLWEVLWGISATPVVASMLMLWFTVIQLLMAIMMLRRKPNANAVLKAS